MYLDYLRLPRVSIIGSRALSQMEAMKPTHYRNFKESTRHLFRIYTMIPFSILIVLFWRSRLLMAE